MCINYLFLESITLETIIINVRSSSSIQVLFYTNLSFIVPLGKPFFQLTMLRLIANAFVVQLLHCFFFSSSKVKL